jgi:hypothetical protein
VKQEQEYVETHNIRNIDEQQQQQRRQQQQQQQQQQPATTETTILPITNSYKLAQQQEYIVKENVRSIGQSNISNGSQKYNNLHRKHGK